MDTTEPVARSDPRPVSIGHVPTAPPTMCTCGRVWPHEHNTTPGLDVEYPAAMRGIETSRN